MRITRESLLNITKRRITEKTYRNRHIICVYMTGSMIYNHPFLGGTTDIDLIFVHDSDPEIDREIIPICNEAHIDITHLSHERFKQTRALRTDPWIGSFLCENAIQMFDSGHWFEFTQAAVCAQFKKPEYVLQRSRTFSDAARESWISLNLGEIPTGPIKVYKYLKILEYAANAIASLSRSPLTERRFLLSFPKCAAAINRPGLSSGFIDLFTKDSISNEEWAEYIKFWTASLTTLGKRRECPIKLDPARISYFSDAAEILWNDHPYAATWILLRIWTQALCYLSETTTTRKRWEKLCSSLDLDDENMQFRIISLDNYLDVVEETIDKWAVDNGIS